MTKPNFAISVLLMPLIVGSCVELSFPVNREGRSSSDVMGRDQTEAGPSSWIANVSNGSQQKAPGEAAYIASRRKAAGSPSGPVIGVAFSGGGVRSATVNLGSLQGLEDSGVLKQVDYLSCVSGGGYIGGWYASHLRSEEEMEKLRASRDSEVIRNFSTVRSDLLEISPKRNSLAVHNIRQRAGLFGSGWTGISNMARAGAWWAAFVGPNLVVDVGTHFQPLPGKFNTTHPFYPYRWQLEETYLMGWPDQSPSFANDINSMGSQTPYLICNGALANSEWSGDNKDGSGRDIFVSDTHNFEFTRDRCGSPLIGWLPTPLFDRTVAEVRRGNGSLLQTEVLKGPLPCAETKPFPLSTAIAASGAAVDSAFVKSYKKKLLLNSALGIVNANLRYQTANFAQDRTEWWNRPADRLREVTSDRFVRTPRSNVLQISDGGHFENLGVYPLLRRGVPVILAFDAGQDKEYEYSDLKRLLQLILECGWSYECNGDWHGELGKPTRPSVKQIVMPSQFKSSLCNKIAPEDPIWHFRVMTSKGKTSSVWYVKNSFRESDPQSKWGKDLTAFQFYPAKGTRDAKEFPHIGTKNLTGWYQQRFDSYREIGRLLARRVSEDAKEAGEVK